MLKKTGILGALNRVHEFNRPCFLSTLLTPCGNTNWGKPSVRCFQCLSTQKEQRIAIPSFTIRKEGWIISLLNKFADCFHIWCEQFPIHISTLLINKKYISPIHDNISQSQGIKWVRAISNQNIQFISLKYKINKLIINSTHYLWVYFIQKSLLWLDHCTYAYANFTSSCQNIHVYTTNTQSLCHFASSTTQDSTSWIQIFLNKILLTMYIGTNSSQFCELRRNIWKRLHLKINIWNGKSGRYEYPWTTSELNNHRLKLVGLKGGLKVRIPAKAGLFCMGPACRPHLKSYDLIHKNTQQTLIVEIHLPKSPKAQVLTLNMERRCRLHRWPFFKASVFGDSLK